MKVNEAKYRSPKWLRNFVDYEINTGEDIKGEPSKKEMKRQFDKRQKAREEAEEARKEQQAREDVRKQREAKQREQDQIEREINTLYQSMIKDFSSSPYGDKIRTPKISGVIHFIYTFEGGEIIKFYDNGRTTLVKG